MTTLSLLDAAKIHIREYVAAVVAAFLMFEGIKRLISAVNYPLADGVLRLINATIQKGFRGVMPLPNDYGSTPWWFHARAAAQGVIVIVLGIFLGLWASSRNRRRSTSSAQ